MPVASNSAETERLPEGGQHDQQGAGESRVAFDGPGKGQAVHLRHLHIQKRQVVWLASLGSGS